jgi:hypothetical protein
MRHIEVSSTSNGISYIVRSRARTARIGMSTTFSYSVCDLYTESVTRS